MVLLSVIITDKGLRVLNKALKPNEDFVPSEIWITDAPGTPAVTDTTAEFCDYTNYNLEPFHITSSYDTNGGVGYTCSVGLNDAYWLVGGSPSPWTKIGLVDSHGTLIAQSAYSKTKTNTEQIEIVFILKGAR